MEKNVKFCDIDNVTFSEYGKSTEIDFCGTKIRVSLAPTFRELLNFCETVCSYCFTLDGDYIPAARDIAFRKTIIDMFTDVELDSGDEADADSMEESYKAVCYSGLYDEVESALGQRLLSTLHGFVTEKIEYVIRTKEESVRSEIERCIGALQSSCESVAGMAKQFNGDAVSELMTALDKNIADRKQLIAAYAAMADKYGAKIVPKEDKKDG